MTERFPQTVGTGETDVGLRNFMVGTYRWMGIGMAFAGAVAYFAANYWMNNLETFYSIFGNPILALVAVGAIFFGFMFVGRALPRMSYGSTVAFLLALAGMLGFLFSASAVIYPGMLIAKVFFMTVALFATLSLFGYTTERNLWSIAKYAIGIFMGLVAYQVLSMFIPSMAASSGTELIIAGVMLVMISIIVAWETQALKSMYYGSQGHPEMMKKLSVFGAASLLLSFYNMFQLLLQLMSAFDD